LEKNFKKDSSFEQLVLIPKKQLDEIQEAQKTIIEKLSITAAANQQGNFISEKYYTKKETKKLLNRGNTWLWHRCKEGKLRIRKLGRSVYYLKEDVEKLFNDGGVK
jgi:hypothetical protein